MNPSNTEILPEQVPALKELLHNYEEATEWVGEGTNSKEFDSFLGNLLQNQEKNTDLKSLFDPIKKYANDILKASLEGAVEIEMLPEKFKDVNYSDNKKLKNQLTAWS